jgi:hypothetical protein
MNPPEKKSRPLLGRVALWSLPLLFVLLVAAVLVGRAWINAYLQGSAFRELVGGLASKRLKASSEFQPFHLSGTTIYSDAFRAEGSAKAAFSQLDADQIRAEINLRGLWQRAWEVDEISLQRLRVSLGHPFGAPVAELPDDFSPEQKPPAAPRSGWLPNRVDLRRVVIRETDLKWGEGTAQSGAVNGAAVTLTPDGDGWNIFCEGGKVTQQGGPELTIDQVRLRYQSPSLFITDGTLHYGADGNVALDGEVNFEKSLDVRAKLGGIPITPFLREDWRAKIKGNLSGEIKIRAALPMLAGPSLEGSLTLTQGELEALPVLDQIALFTRTQRFRKINLTKTSADFTHAADRTTVTNFIAESEGLIRVEGGFVTENGMIDGTFQVGVTPSSLQWLPGSQAKVFTVARGGYLWTTVRLTGPLASPQEDLTRRLVAAAGGEVIDTIQNTIQDLPNGKLPDAPKKLLEDILTPLLK